MVDQHCRYEQQPQKTCQGRVWDFDTSIHVKPFSVSTIGFDVGQGSGLQFSKAERLVCNFRSHHSVEMRGVAFLVPRLIMLFESASSCPCFILVASLQRSQIWLLFHFVKAHFQVPRSKS
jgi:hypothetical protein